MLPQPNWPMGHEEKVILLLKSIEKLNGFKSLKMDYGTGMIIIVKTEAQQGDAPEPAST